MAGHLINRAICDLLLSLSPASSAAPSQGDSWFFLQCPGSLNWNKNIDGNLAALALWFREQILSSGKGLTQVCVELREHSEQL